RINNNKRQLIFIGCFRQDLQDGTGFTGMNPVNPEHLVNPVRLFQCELLHQAANSNFEITGFGNWLIAGINERKIFTAQLERQGLALTRIETDLCETSQSFSWW